MGRKSTRKPKQSTKKQKHLLDHNKTSISTRDDESLGHLKTNKIIKLSDSENEIDALLEEFKEEEINFPRSKYDLNVILSSDDEEMENLLEEFIEDEANAKPSEISSEFDEIDKACEEFSYSNHVSPKVESKKTAEVVKKGKRGRPRKIVQ